MKKRKITGTVITDDIDGMNDQFTMECIKSIDLVGKDLTIDFKPEEKIGTVTKQQILGNGLEIEAEIDKNNNIMDGTFVGKGLGISAFLKGDSYITDDDVRIVKELGEIIAVSIVALPAHPSWVINSEERKDD
jgi:hypothetical protein